MELDKTQQIEFDEIKEYLMDDLDKMEEFLGSLESDEMLNDFSEIYDSLKEIFDI